MNLAGLCIYLKGISLRVCATGSRFICSPPVLDTDIDCAVLVGPETIATLIADGFLAYVNDSYDTSNFVSYRRGNLNVIAIEEPEFFRRFTFATYLAKDLNLLLKRQRVTLFQSVLYDNWPTAGACEAKAPIKATPTSRGLELSNWISSGGEKRGGRWDITGSEAARNAALLMTEASASPLKAPRGRTR